jgi:hypothetical protein
MPIYQPPQFRPLGSNETMGGIGGALTDALMSYEQAKNNRLDRQRVQQEMDQRARLAPIEEELRRQQVAREKSLADLPYGGKIYPGSAGLIMGLEAIRKTYGESSPQFQMAKHNFDLHNSALETKTKYQQAYADTLPQRTLSSTGKAIIESQNVAAGKLPTGAPLTEEDRQVLGGNQSETTRPFANQYELELLKKRSDKDTRSKLLYAENIHKTLPLIDPDAFANYSGAIGSAKSSVQQALSPFGMETQDFDKYLAASRAATLLSKQVRQFYGDSIKPEIEEKLNTLTNPTSWRNSPKQTKELFNQFKGLLDKEINTYYDALRSTSAYEKPNQIKNEKIPYSSLKNTNKETETAGMVDITYNPITKTWS